MEQSLKDSLKNNNLRWTNARQVVFDILENSQKALSARDIFKKIEQTTDIKTDQVSVYRNLSLFSEIGLAHRMQDGRYSLCKHGQSDGAHASHAHHHDHVHIIASCDKCGRTSELEDHSDDLCHLANELKSRAKDFAKISRLTIQGTCKRCRKA